MRLLPEFDNLLLAHADRSRVIADRHRENLTSKNLRVRATVLVDGTVAAFWRMEKKATRGGRAAAQAQGRRAQGDRGGGDRLGGFAEPKAKKHLVRFE